jgi:carbon-monoxide dehydrogenase large subunit
LNAILDALAPLGVTDLPMPATPERIWRAIREVPRGSLGLEPRSLSVAGNACP